MECPAVAKLLRSRTAWEPSYKKLEALGIIVVRYSCISGWPLASAETTKNRVFVVTFLLVLSSSTAPVYCLFLMTVFSFVLLFFKSRGGEGGSEPCPREQALSNIVGRLRG